MGLFSNIGESLRRISFSAKIDDEYFEQLEEQLILADVGAETSARLVSALRERAKKSRLTEASQLRPVLRELVEQLLRVAPGAAPTEHPRVILMIGV
ncbi:MAG: signal recognition particle receptor subunit alpha, partial [Oscillospiraceae bacterium]